jgi:hypothetical protein
MRRRAALAACTLMLLGRPAAAEPIPTHASEVVAYTIAVSLDPATHTLTGTERVTWRNPSPDQVSELWLHLYLNAFRNTRSTFIRESGGQLRGVELPENGWGWIDLTSLALADGTDLLPRATFESPDDGNQDDRTVMKVMLPGPVPAGGEVTFEAAFIARLPRVFARTGYSGDYYLVGQWFPKLGVYEPAGTRGRQAGGWNCHQLHANSEFYADYGRFDVSITTPTRFVVGATGRLVGTTSGEHGTVTRHYQQADVHDFAWTADPSYLEVTGTFSASRDVSEEEYRRAAEQAGRPVDEMRLNDVSIRVLMQPAHAPQGQRYLEAARQGLKYFGLWYGRYPYQTLTVVDPAYGALGSGGMEYPTFITGGTSLLLNRWPFDQVNIVDEVVIHEFGHQFWYGLVGSNEFEEAWLDEGITSYATGRLMDRLHDPSRSMISLFGLQVGRHDMLRLSNSPARTTDRIRQPAWTYAPGAYAFYSYDKPEIALDTLERILGEPLMAKVMRTYAERWRFRHPSSEDFYRTAEDVTGRDLAWFFRPVFEGTDVLDYEVASLSSGRSDPAAGRLGDGPAVTPTGGPDDSHTFDSTVLVRRRGGLVVPQVIRLTFDGGRVETIPWSGAERWLQIKRTTADRLARADIDPDGAVPLDVNWVNNSLRRTAVTTASRPWSARCLFWLQELATLAGL